MSLPQSKPICKIKPRAKKEITAAVPQSLLSLCFYKIKYFFFFLHLQHPHPSCLQLAYCLGLAEKLILIVMISFDVTFPRAISTNGWSVFLPGRKGSR